MIKILRETEINLTEILKRNEAGKAPEEVVADVVKNVRENGDESLYRYTLKFDGADLKSSGFLVSEKEKKAAVEMVEEEFISLLKRAAENIKAFHSHQVQNGFITTGEKGIVMGQKVTPLQRVGIYVPGGKAAYPSTVLMDAIPAKIAGVKEIVMVTPPDEKGNVNPAILAAAKVAGVDKIYKVGGAQAIAALAYGTESIAPVDKIVGPGNAYVAEAKRQVYGKVDIDMIAGPSEILIIADEKATPAYVAADLLSQAEHDEMASAVLITTSFDLAGKVAARVEKQLESLERKEIAAASIENNGKIIVVKELKEALRIANMLAPEHLEICTENPFDYLGLVENAGSVFLGSHCPEVLGDYLAGTNHTLPTGGRARFSSALSVEDFVKKIQYTYYTGEAFTDVAKDVAFFAQKEGLGAHGRSALIRLEEQQETYIELGRH
ncbi:MAG: histidinol dehydrogenase [Lachnospiraceae bacterium]|nr:histidinol dehydrogenase [Lachnospiraceae bacterium]